MACNILGMGDIIIVDHGGVLPQPIKAVA